MSFKEYIVEETNPSVTKAVNKLIKTLKQEYAPSFKKDYSIEAKYKTPTVVEITVNINRFLSDNKDDEKEFDNMVKEVVAAGERAEATKIEVEESFFGGSVAASLIKPGKTINCDALLSYFIVKLTFPVNFKR
jgi:hypothetical protein